MPANEKWSVSERHKLATLILEGGLTLSAEESVDEYREVINAAHSVLNLPAEELEKISSQIEVYAKRACE